ncbi:hypothetical protein EV356DRAFT_513990 [Viridothelium virens]|uniref:G domain-containing protein n=1 Tax=Viridothelium virens TaxID=1048519 RepID=A0A6A6HPC3_VIRVR|nr:hypothetical protein EV356DRAFT_513990 [Viridothelium virens]
MSVNRSITRPALGETANLGTLYDARTDSFLQLALFNGRLPPTAITKIDNHESDVNYISHDSYKAKLSSLDIDAKLGASFMAGLVTVGGSGKYLSAQRDTNLVAQRSLIYNRKTVNERLEFQTQDVKDNICWEALDTGGATHVVSEIVWGSRNIITVKQTLSHKDDAKAVNGALDVRMASLKRTAEGNGSHSDTDQSFDESVEFTLFGDVLADDGVVPTDMASAKVFLQNVPKYIKQANDGKGKHLVYKLMPLSLLPMTLNRKTSIPRIVEGLESESFEKFVQAFDELASVRQELNDYKFCLQQHSDYVSQGHIRAVGNKLSDVKSLEVGLRGDYARKLDAIHAGSAPKAELWQLLAQFRDSLCEIHKLLDIVSGNVKENIRFLNEFVAKGAKYIGFNGDSLELELATKPNVDIHVLHFSGSTRADSEIWKETLAVLHQIMNGVGGPPLVILKDNDAFDEPIVAPYMELIRNTQVIIQDVLRDWKSKRVARCSEENIEWGRPKPLRRIAIKISCPKPECSPSADDEWICYRCKGLVEYGHIDDFLYCDCGRGDYKYWEFRCSNIHHGLGFHDYDHSSLLQRFKALEPFEELNILILGATGVGKSTWINAFVNYLTFRTLPDALRAEKLCWIIPFAFSTYHERDDGEFENMKFSFGFNGASNNEAVAQNVGIVEHDGTDGQSATQCTTVHRVQIGKRLVRLIDTPGIGDTRGPSQDGKNMADILKVLSTYEKLHGILVLLKPNEQKLTNLFRFCIQELLKHLHRDAAQNIAFGFTNTRGTSYKPGDSFDPRRQLLKPYKDVDIGLRTRNVFCFDSESFRYLAAQKQLDKSLGHFEETKSSWKHSVKEAKRLLDYFQSLSPHDVNSTVNLYETRRQVLLMTEPMAEIAETMRNTINVNADRIDELKQKRMTKKDLEKKLKRQICNVSAVAIDQPRTTCADENCIAYENSGTIGMDGKPTLMTVYKSMCHNPCYLGGIDVEQVGVAGLRNCWAMNGSSTCRRCHHPWNIHLHIKHEYKRGTSEINDPTIAALLKNNASEQEIKEAMIEATRKFVEELKVELQTIQLAATQFSIFLIRNAIAPINDATLKYFDDQIEEERGKIKVGGSRDKHDRLLERRRQHEQEIAIFTGHMERGEHDELLSQGEVKIKLQELYSLKYYGDQLRRVKEVVDDGTGEIHREKAYIVGAKAHWSKTNYGEGPDDEDSDDEEQKGLLNAFTNYAKRAWKSKSKGR